MSEIKLKQEVIDKLQERIDSESEWNGEDWTISSSDALEIVADVLEKTMERIVERLEDLKASAFDDETVIMSDAIEIVKEEGGIE